MYIKINARLFAVMVTLLLFLSIFSNAQSPGGVSGATFWARADNGVTTSGSNVTAWTNLANTSNNLTVTATQPTLVSSANINFNPAVTFGGTAVAYTTGNVTPAGSSYSRFVAFKTSTTSAANILGSGFPPSTLATFSLWKPTTANTLSHWAGSNFGNASATYNTGLPNVASAVYANGVLGTYININGTSNTATLNSPSFATGSNVAIGGAFNTTFQNIFNGVIPEAIIYPSALTATQVAHVESYLAIKYGITLSTNYIASNNGGAVVTTWNATTNTGYNNNIAGIGRDDNTALLQKQSQSQNSNDQVTISLGTIASTNAANTGTFAADRQFLVWGDDAGSTNISTPTNLSSYNARMARVWATQNTNAFSSTINIYYPVSAFGSTPASAVGLIFGNTAAALSNGTGNVIGQTGTVSINGVNNYVFNVTAGNVANLKFFSFAANIQAPGGVVGLRLWLRADAGTGGVTSDGAIISTWADQSGNGFNFTATPSKNPIFRTASGSLGNLYNFNPYLDFTSQRAMYRLTAPVDVFSSGADNGAIFVQGHGVSGANGTWIGFSSNSDFVSGAYLDNGKFLSTTTTNLFFTGPQFTVTGLPNRTIPSNLFSANWTGSLINNKTVMLRDGGKVMGTITNTTAFGWGAAPSNQIGINDGANVGVSNDAGSFYASEYVVYNTTLSELDIARINSYMSIKYGTTLSMDNNGNSTLNEVISGSIREGDYVASNGSTVVWAANSTYASNIAGIGRDDNSALAQKQSKSISTGNQVTISIGTIAATNLANTNSITSDRQFLIWGDDAGALTMGTATGRGTYGQRFARIWKTQNTNGFAENITVYFPVSAFGNIAAANVGLIYGNTAAELSNGAGRVIAQSGTTTINGVNNYVFSVPSTEVASMQFFSFATNILLPGGVPGALIWFKADAGVTLNGSGVSAWANQVGTNTNFTQVVQTTPSAQPIYSPSLWNFNPNMTYNTSQALFNTTSLMADVVGATENDVFAAIRVNVNAAVYFQVNDNGSTTSRFNLESNRINFLLGSATTFINSPANFNIPRILSASTTAVSSQITTYINGKFGQSNGYTGTMSIGTPGQVRVYVGSFAGGLGLRGDYPELINFNRSLSATERLQVLSYLSLKYGLTLDQTIAQNYLASNGTTVAWDASTNSAYSNNIAGIGRDDLTALNQKQAISINAGNQAVVSVGAIATANAGNTSTFTSDRQFFMWGDDNASLIPRTLTNKTLSPRRFARVWRTQNTNSFNQSINIYYPVSGFSNALPSSVALIYGTGNCIK